MAPVAERLYRALTYPLLSVRDTAVAAAASLVAYVLLVVGANPAAAANAVSTGVGAADAVLVMFTAGTYEAAGPLGLALTVAYAVLAGITAVAVVASASRGAGGTASLLGVAPGVLAAGCAGCGAGVLPLLGVAGAYALFPFAGNLVRAGGIVLLLFALVRTGDPRRCARG
jgi:hypothetical protein